MDNLNKLLEIKGIEFEEKMWNIINTIGWGVKTVNYKQIREFLKDNFNDDFIIRMKIFCVQKRKELASALDEYEDKIGLSNYYGVGDDGFWDLTAHIVGLGKHWYYDTIKYPEIAKEIADNYMYKENFEYIFNLSYDQNTTDKQTYDKESTNYGLG